MDNSDKDCIPDQNVEKRIEECSPRVADVDTGLHRKLNARHFFMIWLDNLRRAILNAVLEARLEWVFG